MRQKVDFLDRNVILKHVFLDSHTQTVELEQAKEVFSKI
jgi:hypothetical protein